MTTLFIISSVAFALAALGWFCTWAIWIHPPEGWFGRATVEALPMDEVKVNAVRNAPWYRWLKIVTCLLGLTTLALFGVLIREHPLNV